MADTFNDTLSRNALVNEQSPQTEQSRKPIPGAVCWAVNASGEPILPPECQGRRSIQPDSPPMTADTVLYLASTTKLITAVAVLQCVDQGLVTLDEPIGKLLPEFENPDVIVGWRSVDGAGEGGNEEPILRKAKTQLTLRQMMNHTGGISAAIFDPAYQKYNTYKGWPQRQPTSIEHMNFPLRFDPGTKWMYGFGLDWAAILITRLHNCTLDEYLSKHIFHPLSMTSTTFHPLRNPTIRSRLASIHARSEQPASSTPFHPEPFEMWLKDSESLSLESGGYGLYSTPADFIKLLHALIAPDCPLLKSQTVQEMFRPQLASARWLREEAVDGKAVTIAGNILFPERAVNHGLGFVVLDDDGEGEGEGGRYPNGCERGTAMGGGLTNTYWWIDRKSGVAGLVFLNMLPYMDSEAVRLWRDFQGRVYAAL
ncbi:hypothetical protein FQN51_001886 [Onygenales sp. PD_10]|nr:hypothetical protein FQN51_001886 [Onygenales sp. PD_10]